MLVHGLVWTCEPKPSHHFSYGTKRNETSATKKSTIKHSLIGSGRTNQRATINVEGNQALSLSRTQARRLIRSKGNPPRISQNTPASIIFENTSSHVSNKDQDNEMPLHHGVHSRANRHHQSMVHCQLCLVSLWTTMVTQKTPLCHWRWSFHANINEVYSLIFKTAGV
jgi:hypothetical protein